MMTSMIRRARTRPRDDRGVALIEMAMVVPFLLTLVLAIFDLGMMLHSDIAIANASRSAARVGSRDGSNQSADYDILTSLGAALKNVQSGTVNYVTIYKVSGSSTNDAPPSNCTSAAAITARGNAASFCNTYSAADLALVLSGTSAAQADFDGCATTDYDRMWCPTSRSTSQATTAGPDYLGVAVSVNTPTYSHLFGSTKTFTDQFAMRLEPSATAS
jgi:Flp pilus assembly protein TadG